jgi:hypothetical protein
MANGLARPRVLKFVAGLCEPSEGARSTLVRELHWSEAVWLISRPADCRGETDRRDGPWNQGIQGSVTRCMITSGC